MLILSCPACHLTLGNTAKKATGFTCSGCGFQLSLGASCWNAHPDENYPLEFPRQWSLWERGFFGNRSLIYGKTPDEDFSDLLRLLGLEMRDFASQRILDVGFGHGRILRALQNNCPQAYGLDLSLPLPSAHLLKEKVFCGNLFSMPFAPRQFDLVLCRGVLHHTQTPRIGFAKLAEQVREGGILYLYYYEESSPKLLLLRSLFPFSWFYPQWLRVSIAWASGAAISSFRFAQRRGIGRSYQALLGNYVLGSFDAISPRWSYRANPREILRWYSEEGFDSKYLGCCQYRGIKVRSAGNHP